MDLKAESRATAVGSFPHKEAGPAMDIIIEHLRDIPVWPQLPGRAYIEGMCPQYSEGLPAVRLDLEADKISVDTGPDLSAAMEKFYEIYLGEDTAPFATSETFAPGLHEFLRRLGGNGADLFAAKGHITGPITWGLTVCDQDMKASYYNDMLKDGIIKGLARKALWQVQQLKAVNDHVIVFVDEPYLQSLGSAMVALQPEDVVDSLNQVIEGIHQGGAYAGIHCCGNTDWSLLARTEADIINFDAFAFAESLALYPREVGEFLDRGGILAWGIVPNTDALDSMDTDKLMAELRRAMGLLIKHGISESLLLERALITPSCGAESLTIPQSEKLLRLTAEVSKTLRGES